VATEAFTFPAPALPNELDSPVNLGVVWATLSAGSWIGNRIQLPTGAPGITTTAIGYNDDTGAELATKAFTPTPAGSLVDVLWDTPVDVLPDVTYTAGWHTDRYAATGSYSGWPATTTNLYTAASNAARFFYSGTVGRPINASAANYHVSPLVSFGGGEVVQAAAALTAAGVLLVAPVAVVRAAIAMTASAGLAIAPRTIRRAAAALAAAGRLSVTLPADLVKPGVLTPGAATPALLAPGAATAARLEAT
jgi:hypothetical protein